jgi:hypothetical protein
MCHLQASLVLSKKIKDGKYNWRRIYILTPLPRYILVPCCEDNTHYVNLLVKDDETRQAVFDIMDELDQIGKTVSQKFPSCTIINTGDLLAGMTAWRHQARDPRCHDRVLDDVSGKWYEVRLHQACHEARWREWRRTLPSTTSPTRKWDASPPAGNSPRNVRGRGDMGIRQARQHRLELWLLRYSGHPNKRGGWPPYIRGGRRGGNGGGRGGVRYPFY